MGPKATQKAVSGPLSHPWPRSPRAAIALQDELRGRVERQDRLGPVRRVAGADVGFEESGRITRAAVVVLSLPELEVQDWAVARRRTRFPYVPGLLSFREAPAVLAAMKKLDVAPDLLLCDGQGIAHPRRFGLASHIGLLLDLPTIGIAKSRLIGTHAEPGPEKGDWAPLVDGDETVGAVLRTRANVRPVYVSIGHRVSLMTAIDYVLQATPRYRLPETTREADRLSRGRLPRRPRAGTRH
jgi:deoxyribonuclease V